MSTFLGLAVSGSRPAPAYLVDVGDGREFVVAELALACCAVETLSALVATGFRRAAAGQPVDVLLVSGTLTDKAAGGVLDAWRQVAPRRVVSFGSCANTGGPYWDSYSVTKGVDQLLPIDVYVPGCPPRPEALLDALRHLDAPAGAQ